MKSKRLWLLTCIILIVIGCVAHLQWQRTHDLSSQIHQLIHSQNENLDIGVAFQSVRTHQPLYQFNHRRTFVPASNLKLVTAIAALDFLGPDFQYKTDIQFDTTKITEDALNGDVVLRFSGDPTFSSKSLDTLLKSITSHHIKSITGNLIINNGAFSNEPLAKGWMWDELNICYAAPATSVTINHNCFHFTLFAPSKLNQKTLIRSKESLIHTPIDNIVSSSDDPYCDLYLSSDASNHYTVYGCVPPKSSAKTFSVSLKNPARFVKDIVTDKLKAAGVTLEGKVIISPQHISLPVITSTSSAPMRLLVKTMLTKSDNLIANALIKTIGQHYYEIPGSWEDGLAATQEILENDAALDYSQIQMSDASGLSRYNLISPDQLIRLLQFAYDNENIRPYLMAAFPVPGEKGTLEHRLKNLKGKVFAKTGTMHSISALSGYLVTDDDVLAFSIIINNGTQKASSYQSLEDQLLDVMLTAS